MIICNKNLQKITIALAVVFLLVPFSVQAYFFSGAEAEDNDFSIGTLEIEVDNTSYSFDIDESNGDSFSFNTSDVGSIPAQYRVTATPVSCSGAFFAGLDVEATQGAQVYDGDLSGLLLTSTTSGQWDFTISPEDLSAADGEQCEIEILVQAWQTEFSVWDTGGFSDEVAVSIVITASEDIGPQSTADIVLNEVYANPNTASSSPLDIEWIELYNGTGNDVNVAGWFISELSNPGEVGETENFYEIVASGAGSNQAQPYGTTNTVIPAGGLLVIEFNSGQSKLNNDKDTVSLYNTSTSTSLDTYSYISTTEGKSDARIPDGGDWVDPIPSPGESNMSTIKREDLEAENWPDDKIDEVLGRSDEEGDVVPDGEEKGDNVNSDGGGSASNPAKPEDDDKNFDDESDKDEKDDEEDGVDDQDSGADEEHYDGEEPTGATDGEVNSEAGNKLDEEESEKEERLGDLDQPEERDSDKAKVGEGDDEDKDGNENGDSQSEKPKKSEENSGKDDNTISKESENSEV